MDKTLHTMWSRCAREYSALPAVRWLVKKDVQERTYGELCAVTDSIKKGLAAEGFSKAHIALIGTSSVEWIEAYMAVVTTNNAAVPLDCGLPAHDIIELIQRADIEGVFIDAKFSALIESIKANCPKVRKIWLLSEEKCENTETIADLTEAGADTDMPLPPEENDICMIVYTSGTTGKSKGVMLTQSNLYSNIEAILFHIPPGRVFMSVLPVHHAFCLVMDWLNGFWMGGIICINDSFMHMVRNMSIFNPHVMLMVPMMLETIYKRMKALGDNVPPEMLRKKIFGQKLEHIFTGGAHLEPFYIEELKHQTGNDKPVQDYVMSFPEAGEVLDKLTDLLDFLIPNYVKEGKYQLVIGIGCTGGKHRSVTLANALYARMKNKGNYGLKISHRDAGIPNSEARN